MNLDFLNNGQRVYGIGIENHGSYFNAKAVLERKINKASIIRGGVEFQNSIEDMTYQPENAPRFKNIIRILYLLFLLKQIWLFRSAFFCTYRESEQKTPHISLNGIFHQGWQLLTESLKNGQVH